MIHDRKFWIVPVPVRAQTAKTSCQFGYEGVALVPKTCPVVNGTVSQAGWNFIGRNEWTPCSHPQHILSPKMWSFSSSIAQCMFLTAQPTHSSTYQLTACTSIHPPPCLSKCIWKIIFHICKYNFNDWNVYSIMCKSFWQQASREISYSHGAEHEGVFWNAIPCSLT